MTPTDTLVNRVWSYCNVLRDAGLSYGDYLEQLTYLIFLKMADEYARPPYKRDLSIPKAYNWQSLIKMIATTKSLPATKPACTSFGSKTRVSAT